MEVLLHDQFIIRIGRSRRNRRFLRIHSPVSTSIESKSFLGRLSYLDSLSSPNEKSISRRSECCVNFESSCFDGSNNRQFALRRSKDFSRPERFDCEVLGKKNAGK